MKIYTILILATLLLTGCGVPQVSFKPQKKADGIQFHIGLKNANGLLRLKLWEKDTRKTLWDINLNYYPGPILKYGDVPSNFTTFNGAGNSAKQNYPADAAPAPIPVGKDICVCIDYQYDASMAACTSSKCYAFRLEPDGTIVDLGEQPFPSEGQ